MRPKPLAVAALLAVVVLALAGCAGVMLALNRGADGRLAAALTWAGRESPLDMFWDAPVWALTDHFERPVQSHDLRGRAVLANFIYTSCPETCPLLSVRMKAVQERLRRERILGSRVVLLSFSVDPARDTPAVLRTYAEQYGADRDAWRFLTGPERYVLPLVNQGFRLGAQHVPLSGVPDGGATGTGGSTYDTMHSNRFVLIDLHGRIRAYYDGLALDLDRVVRDVRWLLR